MINIALSGCNGKMGRVISRLVSERQDIRILFGVDINTESSFGYEVYKNFKEAPEGADAVIDFSHPACFEDITSYCRKTGTPLVLATTGLSDEQRDSFDALSEDFALFFSANMSLGVNLIASLVKKAAQLLEDSFDIEIIEKHHNQKIDAPSGTALMLADEIADSLSQNPRYVYDRHSTRQKRTRSEIGIHAVRGGTIVGEHDVIFAGNDEIIEISHKAMSKEIFAVGAIKAAQFIAGKKNGRYSMKNIMEF